MDDIETKINKLIEEALSSKFKNLGKAATIAGVGGLAGAGLDVYFNGGRNIDEFIKPLSAWGVGGALGGILGHSTNNSRNELKAEIKEELLKDKQMGL